MGRTMNRLAFLIVCIVVAGCGGSGSNSTQSQNLLTGVWKGTMALAGSQSPWTVEIEQNDLGDSIAGVMRVTTPSKVYHGKLTGLRTGSGYNWSSDLGQDLGTLDFTGTQTTSGIRFTFGSRSRSQTSGTGAATQTRTTLSANYAGVWNVNWTESNGNANNFPILIQQVNGQNQMYQQEAVLPANGGWVLVGSIVGDTISITAFSAAALDAVNLTFNAAAFNGSGTFSGDIIAQQNSGHVSGTYTITSGGN